MKVRLTDLPDMHPALLWDDILAATAATMDELIRPRPYSLIVEIENVPNQANGPILLEPLATGIPAGRVAKIRRTLDPHRRVEAAAIALAGITLHLAGGHQIRDVALRGTGADYLVDDGSHFLEVTGRSRRRELRAAWEARWQRLSAAHEAGFYLCAFEFETPSGRLGFAV